MRASFPGILILVASLLWIPTDAWAEGRVCEAGSPLDLRRGLLNPEAPIEWSSLTPVDLLPATTGPGASTPGHNNIAALYCLELGDEVAIEEGEGDEGQEVCAFPDGTSCPEWDFYAGTCGADSSLCAKMGLEQVAKDDGKDVYSPRYTACVVDETEVNVSDMLGFPQRFNTSIGPIDVPSVAQLSALIPLAPNPLPAAFTWRNKDGQDWMTPVRNQSQCGSCWAFSAVGATEAVFNVERNNSSFDLDLSEELLNGGSAGSCCGGWHYKALDIIKNPGIPDEACLAYDVPYYNTGGCDCFGNPPCNASCNGLPTECSNLLPGDACADIATRRTTIANYQFVPNNIDTIKTRLIDEGPLSVCYAHQGRWNGSVYECPFGWCRDAAGTPGAACSSPGDPVCPTGTSCQPITMNHCVVLAGYDDNGGNGFWVLKNSWGAGFDGDGYFNLRYDQCLVQTAVYYVDSGTTPNRGPTADANGPYDRECQGSTTAVPLDGSGSSDPDGDALTYAWTSTCPGASFDDATAKTPVLGVSTASLASPLSCSVGLTVEDPGTATSSDQASVTIRDTTPPTITCPTDHFVECKGPAGAPVTFPPPVATDVCSASPGVACVPPSGSTFPLGTTTDTCTATDASGNSASCTFRVGVVDTTPPVIASVSASPNVLWPPNHKLVPVSVSVQASDLCGPATCAVVSVASNEPENAVGDGNTAPDWQITGPLAVALRAERAGPKSGRSYSLTVQCTDPSGNAATKAVAVSVPHDRGKK